MNTEQLVNSLNSEVNTFQANVNQACNRIDSSIKEINASTNRIYNQIETFKKTMIESEQKSIARENILKIEQKINEQLSSYLTVRRSVTGIIKDMDFNLVRNHTITEMSEELWLSSSKYWLSYVMISLSAWIQDRMDIAESAIAEAVRRDRVKVSLFYCLLNLRFGRHAAAKKWIFEYFSSIDPVNPPKESALMLQAFLYGAFGGDKVVESAVQETVEGWIKEIETNAELSDKLVGGYYVFINTFPSKANFDYPGLNEYCLNKAELQSALGDVSRYQKILNMLSSIQPEQLTGKENYAQLIDGVLDSLVNNYDDEELKLRNEQKYYQLIIDNDGDMDKANAQFVALSNDDALGSNIGMQMLDWALLRTNANIDPNVQLFALGHTKNWFIRSVGEYEARVKTGKPTGYEFKIDLWHEVTDGKDREKLAKSVEDTYAAEKLRLCVFTKANITLFILAIIFAGLSVAAGLVVSHLGYGFYGWFGFAIPVIFVVIMLATTLASTGRYPKRMEKTKQAMFRCLDEIDSYHKTYAELESVKDKLVDKIYYL